jgi:hypothetical protein
VHGLLDGLHRQAPCDEEKHVSKYTPAVPTIIITPPSSPIISAGHHAHSAKTSWPISEPNPLYLHPMHYIQPLHRDLPRESRHRSFERRQREGPRWWTLTAVLLLLIISSSLHGMYSIHSSEARACNESAHGLARQEPEEGACIPNPVDGGHSLASFRFELPRFFEWLA